MSADDQTENLASELLILQSVFDKCVAEGDVPGFTRAKAKIKKLEALRQEALKAKADATEQSIPGAANSIDFQPAPNVINKSIGKAENSELLSSSDSGKLQTSDQTGVVDHSHEAPSEIRPSVTQSHTRDTNGHGSLHHEVITLDEIAHTIPKPAQSLAMLLLQSLENSAQTESHTTGPESASLEKSNGGSLINMEVAQDAATAPQRESIAEGLLDELVKLAQTVEGEQSAEDKSVIADTQVDAADAVQPVEYLEPQAAIVLTELPEPIEDTSKISEEQNPTPEVLFEETSNSDASHEVAGKMSQTKKPKPANSVVPPVNSAKKELAKFWKFITKPEAFMEDQNVQDPSNDLQKPAEPEKN